jgi:predicted phage tail component-like protein
VAVSFSFDGTRADEFGIYLGQSHRRLHGGTRERRVTIPGRPGQYDAGSEPDMRQLELELAMIAPDRRTLNENLHAFAAVMDPTKGYRQLIFDDDPERCLYAKLVGDVPNDLVMLYSTFTITVQADPYYYDLEPTMITWNATGGGSTTIENGGTAECPVQITVTPLTVGRVRQVAAGLGGVGALLAPLSAPTLTVAGTTVGYTGQLLPGDTVVIDTDAYTLEKNGTLAIEDWTGEMPLLPPGDVALVENDSHDVGATFELSFTQRYL